MIPQIWRACCTIWTTSCDDETFKLFILRAKAMDERASVPLSEAMRVSHSLATWSTFVRIDWSRLETSARRSAVGGVVPGLARAWVRTNARARPTAAVAMPSQQLAQRMCENGTIVWLAMSANGVARI